jgi:hypothetical protein
LKEAVCLPFMFSRVVREDRAARTVLVLAGSVLIHQCEMRTDKQTYEEGTLYRTRCP